MMFKYCVKKLMLSRTFYTCVTLSTQIPVYYLQAQKINKLSDMFLFISTNVENFKSEKIKIFSTFCWKLRNIQIDPIVYTEQQFKQLLDKICQSCKFFRQFLLVYKFLVFLRKNEIILKQFKKSKISEKHILNSIKKLRNHIESKLQDQNINNICDYFAVSNGIKYFSHVAFQLLQLKQKQINKQQLMKLLKSFLQLQDIQKQFIYNFTYTICSKINLNQWSQQQQAILLYQLRQLNLQKNTTFQKQLYLQRQLKQNLINSKITLESAKLILKINKFTSEKQKKVFIYMPLFQDIEYCIQLLENKFDYPIPKLITHCENVLMNSFKKENNLFMLNRISAVIGQKLSWTNMLREKYLNCSKWNLKYYVDWLKIGSSLKIDMSQFYLYCFRKVKQKCDDPRNQILHLRVFEEFNQLKKKKYNIKIFKNDEAKQIQALIIEKFINILQNTTRYFKVLYVKQYTKCFLKSQIPTFKDQLLPLILTTFQNLYFNSYQKLYILLNSQQVNQQSLKYFPTISTKLVKNSQINGLKIIYAAIKDKTQPLFKLIWRRFTQNLEPKDKISILLKTPCQFTQVSYNQVFTSKNKILSDDQINSRDLVLLFNYIADKVRLCEMFFQYNLIDDNIYRKFEIFTFVLRIIQQQDSSVNMQHLLELLSIQLNKLAFQLKSNQQLMKLVHSSYFSLFMKIMTNKNLKDSETIVDLKKSTLKIASQMSFSYVSKSFQFLQPDIIKSLILIVQFQIISTSKVQYIQKLLDILNYNKCDQIIYQANCDPVELRKLITNPRIIFK